MIRIQRILKLRPADTTSIPGIYTEKWVQSSPLTHPVRESSCPAFPGSTSSQFHQRTASSGQSSLILPYMIDVPVFTCRIITTVLLQPPSFEALLMAELRNHRHSHHCPKRTGNNVNRSRVERMEGRICLFMRTLMIMGCNERCDRQQNSKFQAIIEPQSRDVKSNKISNKWRQGPLTILFWGLCSLETRQILLIY